MSLQIIEHKTVVDLKRITKASTSVKYLTVDIIARIFFYHLAGMEFYHLAGTRT